MNEQALRFRFGIFVLASFILLGVLTILFGGFPNYFKRTDTYTLMFTNAQGITPGTPVRRSGVGIGEVRSVTLDNVDGKVVVVIRVDSRYNLRKSDRPTITSGLIGGDAAIAILPPEDGKPGDNTLVEPGGLLNGFSPTDPSVLIRKTSDLVDPAQEALMEIRKVFLRINKMAPLVEETLKDFREVGKMARDVGPELQKTAQEIRALSRNMDKQIPELSREIQLTTRSWGKVGERVDVLLQTNEDKIVKSIDQLERSLKRVNEVFSDENQKYLNETLRNVRNGTQQLEVLAKDTGALIRDSQVTVKQVGESMKKADQAIDNLQKVIGPISDKSPKILKNLEESTDNLNRTLKDMRELMQVFGRSDGTVQKLLSDPTLYNNVNDSVVMVTKILPRLDRALRDVEVFADKLARHPELLGIGGVVRPSSGLRDSPSMPYRTYP
jgi:phospholipid/cholesterol/gamma-HCH transport system substrate-binding protein